METSVIIPVYNAADFVSDAVSSALNQPEVSEVIVIEDASTDSSLAVCKQISATSSKVRLLRHHDGNNHGAGATRNLGITSARFDYIAFLDADDYFLSNRFSVARELFEKNPEIDGVYEAVGVQFQDRAAEQRWSNRPGRNSLTLTTMTERVAPERLFESQTPIGHSGYCPTGGWVVKRPILSKCGMFDEHLLLHQDTVLFVKLAAVGKFMAGRLDEPVAMRRVHEHNRTLAPRSALTAYRYRVSMWATLWRWGKHQLGEERQSIVLKRFLRFAARPRNRIASSPQHWFQRASQLTYLLFKYPDLGAEAMFRSQYLYSLGIYPFAVSRIVRRIRSPNDAM